MQRSIIQIYLSAFYFVYTLIISKCLNVSNTSFSLSDLSVIFSTRFVCLSSLSMPHLFFTCVMLDLLIFTSYVSLTYFCICVKEIFVASVFFSLSSKSIDTMIINTFRNTDSTQFGREFVVGLVFVVVTVSGLDGSRTRVRNTIPCPSTSVVCHFTFPLLHGNKHPCSFSSFMIRPYAQSFA